MFRCCLSNSILTVLKRILAVSQLHTISSCNFSASPCTPYVVPSTVTFIAFFKRVFLFLILIKFLSLLLLLYCWEVKVTFKVYTSFLAYSPYRGIIVIPETLQFIMLYQCSVCNSHHWSCPVVWNTSCIFVYCWCHWHHGWLTNTYDVTTVDTANWFIFWW